MLTIYQFIILAAGVLAALQFTNIKSTFFKIVLVAQLVAIILTLPILGPVLYMLGFFIFYSASLAIALNGMFSKGRTLTQRIVLVLITLPGILSSLFKLQHWPYVQQLMLLNIIAVFVYLVFVLTKRKQYKNAFGPLTIVAADALIHVLMTLDL